MEEKVKLKYERCEIYDEKALSKKLIDLCWEFKCTSRLDMKRTFNKMGFFRNPFVRDVQFFVKPIKQ